MPKLRAPAPFLSPLLRPRGVPGWHVHELGSGLDPNSGQWPGGPEIAGWGVWGSPGPHSSSGGEAVCPQLTVPAIACWWRWEGTSFGRAMQDPPMQSGVAAGGQVRVAGTVQVGLGMWQVGTPKLRVIGGLWGPLDRLLLESSLGPLGRTWGSGWVDRK